MAHLLYYENNFFRRWLLVINISGFCIFRPFLTKDNQYEFKPSILFILITITELIGILIILILQMYYGKTYTADDFTGTIILDTIFFGGPVVSFLQILLSQIQIKRLYVYAKAIVNPAVDSVPCNVPKFASCFKKYFYPFLCIYSFSFIWDCSFFILVKDPLYILHLIALYISHYYNLLVISQYAMAIFTIKNKLETVNAKLAECRRKRGIYKIGDVGSMKNILQNNQIGMMTGEKVQMLDAVEQIKKYRQYYQNIFDLCLKANKAFSAKLLLAIGYNFLMATLFIFFGVQNTATMYNKGWSTHRFWHLSTSYRTAATHILSIYGLIYASNLVCNEVCKMVRMVHIMLIETENPQLEAQLHAFLVQIKYQKIAFQPHAFFELNNSFLLTILGAISSYLIILLQFRVEL